MSHPSPQTANPQTITPQSTEPPIDTIPTTPSSPDTSVVLRPPEVADAADMWRLARDTVDVNSPYSYLMLAEHFASTSAVARAADDDRLAGFVTGFRLPEEPSTLFIWQVAVDAAWRGHGIASRLLDHVADRPMAPRLRFLEATVGPTNEASARTFRRFARGRDAACEERLLFDRDVFPDGDHESEHLFHIGPF